MGFLNWLRRKPGKSKNEKAPPPHLAFVLLAEARLPRSDEIATHFRAFAKPDESLRNDAGGAKDGSADQIHVLQLSSGETCFVALMPAAVPNGEADRGAEFSLCSFRDGWKLPPHRAHLLVTLQTLPEVAPLDSLSRFTSVLAAVTRASSAVGIYWGNAGATHDSGFFTSVASDLGIVPRITLWTGVSVAHESADQLSLLSLGMTQLALPNLMLVAGRASKDEALETFFDLLGYVANRGEPIREGETVGRTDDQRLPVRYVDSPVNPGEKVWRVELP